MDKINTHFIKPAIPWLFATGGIIILIIGNFMLNETPYEKFCISIGTSILSGGVFAVILKTIQFLGVFKEELNSVIFESKFLRNRNDLPIFWEKVTKEFIKDKFPKIHTSIFKDVKEQYLPVSLVQYYENYQTIMEVEMIDEEKEIVKVSYKTSFTIIMADNHKDFTHPYKNSITCKKDCPHSRCDIKSVKLNGTELVHKIKHKQYYSDNMLKTEFDLKLNDKQRGHTIEVAVEKTYSLKDDNIIGYNNTFILNKMKIQLFFKGVKGTFVESGNLYPFKIIHNKTDFLEVEYNNLLYKGQGYYVILNK